MPWYLTGTRPHVEAAGKEIGGKFNVGTIYGLGARPNASDHPFGLALDFMVGNDRAKGDAVTAYTLANASRLAVKYVIWWERIWNPSAGWRPYSGASPHRDHPHVSFLATPGPNGPIVDSGGIQVGLDLNPLDDVKDALQNILKIFQAGESMVRWLLEPQNWLRIGAFGVGLALLLTGLRKLVGLNVSDVPGIGSLTPQKVAAAVKKPEVPKSEVPSPKDVVQ